MRDTTEPSFLVPLYQVPERISSLVPPARKQAMREHQGRSVSAASRLSEVSMSSAESTTSDFLDAKIAALEDEAAYIECVKDGLDEAAVTGRTKDTDLQRELAPLANRMRSTTSTLSALKRQRNLLVEDLEDALALKRQRFRQPSDEGLLETAYADTIIPRVMNASAKQRGTPFAQGQFKTEVNRYYGMKEKCKKGTSWCHVLGIELPKESVKAAHLVPKSPTDEEVAHLFGVGEVVLSDPRNGKRIPRDGPIRLSNLLMNSYSLALSLHTVIEGILDQGTIAVVPIPGALTAPTTWRCVVLDESKNKDIVYRNVNLTERTTDPIRVQVSLTYRVTMQDCR